MFNTKPNKDSLIENKREMFDGMRAYHQSEIHHANHAITMLLAIAAAEGAVVLAMVTQEVKLPLHLNEIAWALFLVVMLLTLPIAIMSHIKISSDHNIYQSFGKEYVNTSRLLGFYDEVQINGMKLKIKESEKIGQGGGYRKSQMIIWALAIGIIFLAFLFVCISYRLSYCH